MIDYAEWLDRIAAATDDAMWAMLASTPPPQQQLARAQLRERLIAVLGQRGVKAPAKVADAWLLNSPADSAQASQPASGASLRPTADLLFAVRDVLNRFVILPGAAARLALALYVLHTHAFAGAHCTPYLVLRSAAKRSGKTRLEEVLELLVRSPWRIAAASESAMFRKISVEQPTLLLDEVDALFGRSSETTEPIRQILNAGNRPGVAVSRMVGEGANMQPADFEVYSPKILAGIVTPRWPDTVLDRSIVIQLQRKTPGEAVERLRYRKLRAETESLRAELARWGQEHAEKLRDVEPELPAKLDDRAAESWEPLLAIADLAERESGERWGELARQAALKLAEARVEDDAHGVVALAAIKTIFGDREALHTTTIVEKLNGADTLPFGGYRKGAGLSGRGLATLLKPFAIGPENVRIGDVQAKGYRREPFVDSWARYCPDPAQDGSYPSKRPNPSGDGGFGGFPIRPTDPSGTDAKTPESPVSTGDGTLGRIETSQEGAGTQNGASGEPGSTIDYDLLCNGSAPARTVADLSDEELLAIFPGATIEHVEEES